VLKAIKESHLGEKGKRGRLEIIAGLRQINSDNVLVTNHFNVQKLMEDSSKETWEKKSEWHFLRVILKERSD
jgi:hypothetical protein